MRKTIIFILLLFGIFLTSYSQESIIVANIKVDNFGNLHVNENFTTLYDTIIIDSKILIHRNYATLIRSKKLEGVKYIEYAPIAKNISYVVNLPKAKSNTYLKREDFFSLQ